MSIKRFLITVLLLLYVSASGNEFSRSEELPYMTVKNTDIIHEANSIFLYISSLNGKEITTEGYISLGRDDTSTKLDLPIAEKDFKLFPKESYQARIQIDAHHGTIKEFTIALQDSYRKVTVQGQNLNDVIATLNVAIEKLKNYEVPFGGIKVRFILLVLLHVVFIGGMILVLLYSKIPTTIYWTIYTTLLVLLQLFIYVPNWSIYFPGFKASETGISLLESSSPLLSLIGVVLAILIPIISYIVKTKKPSKSDES